MTSHSATPSRNWLNRLRRFRTTNGVLYCAMICFTLIMISLISTLGK